MYGSFDRHGREGEEVHLDLTEPETQDSDQGVLSPAFGRRQTPPINLANLVLGIASGLSILTIGVLVYAGTENHVRIPFYSPGNGRGSTNGNPDTHRHTQGIPQGRMIPIELPEYTSVEPPKVSYPTDGEFVTAVNDKLGVHGRHAKSGKKIIADWSATRIFLEFSGSTNVWADLRSANLTKYYSQKEEFWCPHYAKLYQRLNATNSAYCPYWFDVWDAYVDGKHTGTIRVDVSNEEIKKDPAKAIRAIASGLSKDQKHTLMLFKRTGPKKGGTIFGGFILAKGAKIHQANNPYRPNRRIEILGASEENGECALGVKSDFYSSLLESSVVSYGALLGEHFQADYHLTAMGSEGIVLASKPDSAPYLKYYKRTLYADAESSWNFTSFEADLVLVANGITDWGNVNNQTKFLPTFAEKFADLLEFVREQYPHAWIVMVPWKENQINGMKAGMEVYHARSKQSILNAASVPQNTDDRILLQVLKQENWPQIYRGCANHPGPLGHLNYALQIAPTIKDLLGWEVEYPDTPSFLHHPISSLRGKSNLNKNSAGEPLEDEQNDSTRSSLLNKLPLVVVLLTAFCGCCCLHGVCFIPHFFLALWHQILFILGLH
ncbi:hypothetical protein AAMO2058_000203800 [Amorphochlora amoebiformis]